MAFGGLIMSIDKFARPLARNKIYSISIFRDTRLKAYNLHATVSPFEVKSNIIELMDFWTELTAFQPLNVRTHQLFAETLWAANDRNMVFRMLYR